MNRKACVIGAGPNGLAAAIVLAQAGLQVDVLEAEPTPGGAARTMELTLPGYLHDCGSAVYPLGRGRHFSHTDALCRHLAILGSDVKTSSRVATLSALPGYDLFLCDVTPRQLLKLAGKRLSDHYKHRLQSYRYGPGVFKVDYALHAPIPWKASDCSRAATLHLGGSFEEIAASEQAVRDGWRADRLFVLLAQPSLLDPSRAPQGKHTAWAYCHVPKGSNTDVLSKLEDQIERFAPGFRDCVVARRVFSPADFERMDANLVGGDIGGGVMDIRQFLFRPTWKHYATSAKDIYICSSSTPPGGGVHGMCGYHGAKMALSRLKLSSHWHAPGARRSRIAGGRSLKCSGVAV